MVEEIISKYFIENARLATEHKSRLYPTHSSVYVNYGKYKKLQGKCMRAAYYNCMGLPELDTTKTSSLTIMKLGDYTEDMILDMLKSTKDLVSKAVKFDIEKYNIYGKLDAILNVDKQEVGLEIKSIGSNKWAINGIWGSPWNEPAPKWQHLLQTLIYCYAFRDRLSKFIILYIRRDNCETKEFEISIVADGDLIYPVIDGKIDRRYTINDILDRYKSLQAYLDAGKVPPRDFVKIYPANLIPQYARLGIITKKQAEDYKKEPFGDFECRFCGYADVCDKDI